MSGEKGPATDTRSRWDRRPRSASGTLGAVLVALVLCFVLIGPLVWTVDPNIQNLIAAFSPPSAAHPLGTDDQGRDLLARLVDGGRVSLGIGVGSMLIGLVLGAGMGVLAAVKRGWVEIVCLRLIDALLALPGIVQAVILAAVIGRGVGPLIVALGIYSTPIFARVAYTSARQVMTQDYIAAVQLVGAGATRITLRHILPNIMSPLTAIATLRIGSNILTGAALNFFGLGVRPPAAEWGLMIADGRMFSWEQPMMLFLPGFALFITGIGFNLLGDGLRDWLDPHSPRH